MKDFVSYLYVSDMGVALDKPKGKQNKVKLLVLPGINFPPCTKDTVIFEQSYKDINPGCIESSLTRNEGSKEQSSTETEPGVQGGIS